MQGLATVVAGALVAVGVAAGGTFAAAESRTPSTSVRATTIRGCVDRDTGALRILDDWQHCRLRHEQALRWSVAGPRGPQGAPGPQGVQGVAGPVGPAGQPGEVTYVTQGGGMGSSPTGGSWADGPGALAAATAGSTQSTAVGVNPLNKAVGANNTGFGYGAARTVVSGYGNTALGTAAMYEAGPDAFFNVAIGLHAGRYVTGGGNVIIGTDAGGNAGSIDESVIIGHDAYAGGGGRVAIGSGARSEHTNSVAIGRGTVTNGPAQVNVGPRDVEITDASKGVVLRSPSGTRFRLTVADDGTLTTTPIP